MQTAVTTALKVDPNVDISTIYRRVTGKTLNVSSGKDIQSARLEFANALETHMQLMKAIPGNHGGLEALLQGKGFEYIQKLKQYIADGGKLDFSHIPDNKRQKALNAASDILGIGLSALTGGIAVVDLHTETTFNADSIIKELANRDSFKAIASEGSMTEKGWTYIKKGISSLGDIVK